MFVTKQPQYSLNNTENVTCYDALFTMNKT